MAKLICENGDFFALDSFQRKSNVYDEYTPDCSLTVTVKSGSFYGAVQMSTFVDLLKGWYQRISEICQNYQGSITLEDENPYYLPSTITFRYLSRGYIQVCGTLAEDCPNGQRLYFSVSAPVGNFDAFLSELRSEFCF